MKQFKTFLTVIGAITVLVLAANSAAYAATGGKFILGHTNKANKASTLKRTTNGPALNLVTKSSLAAPFSANGLGKVTNLNADRVDGLDGASLQSKSWVYTIPNQSGVSSFSVTFPGLPSGVYQAHYNATMSISATAGVNCEFNYSDTGFALLTYGAVNNTFSAVSGGGIVDTRGRTVKLRCFTFSGTMSSTSPASQVSFTRVDSIANAASVNGRVAPSGARTGASASN